MNNALVSVILLGFFIAPIMWLVIRLVFAIGRLNLTDFYLLSLF